MQTPKIPKPRQIQICLIPFLVVFVACYFQTFQWLNYKYQGAESYYSHGYLIPLVSGYLIYQSRRELKGVPLTSQPSGLVLIVTALLLHLMAALADVNFLSPISMIVYLTGSSLYFFGTAFTARIAFPLFYLVFMCPLPNEYIDVIALPFKSMATTASLYLIDLIGIPYVREGFRLHLPTSVFIVGTPCNGMRSLISFLALGCLILPFLRTPWWKRAAFLLIIPPISIILNALRISILLYIASRYGQEKAQPESYLHDASGMFVFIIGVMFILYLSRRLDGRRSA